MNWIPHFASGSLAIAGLLCALGPVLIHLLNRRRFRRVEWAAMEFLAEALRQQRRRRRLRDLLLLLLRTTAVLLVGLALARPYFSGPNVSFDAGSPRHLILLIDNSLSMSYRPVNATLLQQAKQEARQLIESLPDGSQVTVMSTCGSPPTHSTPLRDLGYAVRELEAVEVVDAACRFDDVVGRIRTAVLTATPLPDQVVLVTDLQRRNWPPNLDDRLMAHLPKLFIRPVTADHWDNAWIEDVRPTEELVGLPGPVVVRVTVRHIGTSGRKTQLTVRLNDQVVATRSLELLPGQSERVITFECPLDEVSVSPAGVVYVPLQASLSPDRLEGDDQRTVMIPMGAAIPVVFVDQVADHDENPIFGRLGETRPLRQLASAHVHAANAHPLLDVRHVSIEQLDPSLLSTARLVVLGGVYDPGSAVAELREYVQQGGRLLIGAGEGFDAAAWNRTAWLQGQGILPAPLLETPVGQSPIGAEAAELVPFTLAWDDDASDDSSADPLLRIPGLSDHELRALYREPLFFQAIAIASHADQQERAQGAARPTTQSSGSSASPLPPADGVRSSAQDMHSLQDNDCRVVARFEDVARTPFLVTRRVGKGEIVFASTSFLPTWNNMAQTNAVILWDHLMRLLIRGTLPSRDYISQEQITTLVPHGHRGLKVQLERPGQVGGIETLEVRFTPAGELGLTFHNAWTRGCYQLTTLPPSQQGSAYPVEPWKEQLSVNGPPEESDLSALTPLQLRDQIVDPGIGRLLAEDEGGFAAGPAEGGSRLWRWLLAAVLLLLLTELLLLAISSRHAQHRSAGSGSGQPNDWVHFPS